jgi:hypothetical protein
MKYADAINCYFSSKIYLNRSKHCRINRFTRGRHVPSKIRQ